MCNLQVTCIHNISEYDFILVLDPRLLKATNLVYVSTFFGFFYLSFILFYFIFSYGRGYDFSKTGFGPRTVILCDQVF